MEQEVVAGIIGAPSAESSAARGGRGRDFIIRARFASNPPPRALRNRLYPCGRVWFLADEQLVQSGQVSLRPR